MTYTLFARLTALHDPNVDVLATRILMTMDRHQIPIGLQRSFGRRVQPKLLVICRRPIELRRENPVHVDLRLVVVMDQKLQVARSRLLKAEFTPQPDVRRIPFRSDHRARSAAGAETSGRAFPISRIKPRLEPVVRRLLDGIVPGWTFRERRSDYFVEHWDSWNIAQIRRSDELRVHFH